MSIDLQTILSELRQLRKELRAPAKMLWTVEETAQALALAPKTIRNQLSAGTFPVRAVRAAGGVRFRKVDVDKYVAGLGVGK